MIKFGYSILRPGQDWGTISPWRGHDQGTLPYPTLPQDMIRVPYPTPPQDRIGVSHSTPTLPSRTRHATDRMRRGQYASCVFTQEDFLACVFTNFKTLFHISVSTIIPKYKNAFQHCVTPEISCTSGFM